LVLKVERGVYPIPQSPLERVDDPVEIDQIAANEATDDSFRHRVRMRGASRELAARGGRLEVIGIPGARVQKPSPLALRRTRIKYMSAVM
jgi:hypothetical protein